MRGHTSNEERVAHALIGAFIGIIQLFIGVIRLIIWGGRKAHEVYRKHHPPLFNLPPAARFEHTHIVAGSGHGKTQLLQQLILFDLDDMVKPGQGSIIVIDSQGDMIRTISHLSMMSDLSDRLVMIDPNDIDYPPALNLFDFGLDRLVNYSHLEREKLLNGAIDLYEYLFGALLGAELTQKQGVIFRYLARLMMVVPGGTIHTLVEFMENPETARKYIAKLDKVSRYFFETQFFASKFDNTREQILTRLWGVLSNPILERMFGNAHNKLNIFSAMNSGSIILINTAKDLLKQEGCEILGRFFIALIYQAAQERASIQAKDRKPTFVYIDEAADYFDARLEQLCNQARKYKVGLILAHQNLDQFDQKLRATVLSSTTIKIVGALSAKDTSVFAKEMRCEEEGFHALKKYSDHTEFACFVRNYTPEPFSLGVPLGSMEKLPRLDTPQYDSIVRRNRRRYCVPRIQSPVPAWQQSKSPAPGAGIGKPNVL